MSGVSIVIMKCNMLKISQYIIIVALFIGSSWSIASNHNLDKDVITWVQKIIRPYFLSDNKDKIKEWFSDDAFNDAMIVKKSLTVEHFGKIEVEQKATINGVPAWRILVAIRAKLDSSNKTHDFFIQMLILRNKDGHLKVNHIDRHEMKPVSEK